MAEIKINEILKMLPHRYPFLLVDKILEVEDNRIVGVKNISMNEPQFTGHFPENPIYPGVLQLEALAQVGGVYCGLELQKQGHALHDRLVYFTSINNVKFKRLVIPGDVLKMEIVIERMVERAGAIILQMKAKATVEDDIACTADLGAWIVQKQA